MIRIGRYTAALSLTALGVLLLLEYAGAIDAMAELRVWWPVVLVALGIEWIILQGLNRHSGLRARPAIGTLIGAAVLGGFVLFVTHGGEWPFGWVQRTASTIHLGFLDDDKARYSFDKGTKIVPAASATKGLTLSNVNGKVVLAEGPVPETQVKAVLYVDVSDRTEAERLAEQSEIRIKEGARTEIVAYGKPYGAGKLRRPRMDVTVTFPQGRVPPSVEVTVGNGSFYAEGLTGPGDLKLDMKNGDVTASQIERSLEMNLLNGNIRLSKTDGSVQVESVNGNIEIRDPKSAVTAQTVHGNVDVSGSVVGGDWNVHSTMGNVKLALPPEASVRVNAESTMGNIRSDWPLDMGKHQAEGDLGNGRWELNAETQMGSIVLLKSQP